jgi:hypothetical protein
MGRRRGQRNAAREKFWAGQDSADVRALKENGGVAQRTEHGASISGVAGSIPAAPAMDEPPSDIARVYRQRNANGEEIRPKIYSRRKRTWVGGDAPLGRRERNYLSSLSRKAVVDALIKEMGGWNKLDAFVKICRMGTRIEYALPELFYVGDPLRAVLFIESIDLTKFALAINART